MLSQCFASEYTEYSSGYKALCPVPWSKMKKTKSLLSRNSRLFGRGMTYFWKFPRTMTMKGQYVSNAK